MNTTVVYVAIYLVRNMAFQAPNSNLENGLCGNIAASTQKNTVTRDICNVPVVL